MAEQFVPRVKYAFKKSAYTNRKPMLAALLKTAKNKKAVKCRIKTHGDVINFRSALSVMLKKHGHKLHVIKNIDDANIYYAWADQTSKKKRKKAS